MSIKFITDHIVDGPPREAFKEGQVVKGRSPDSEMHFVRRGVAGFLDEKKGTLTDHEGREIVSAGTATVLNVSANRDGEVGRAGEAALADGTPQRGSPGPAVVTTTSVTAGEATKAAGGKSKG